MVMQAKRRAAAAEESIGVATLGGGVEDYSDSAAGGHSSDEDQRQPTAANLAQAAPVRPGAEAAHAGMVPALRQQRKVAPTLADREALALSLLSGS
jgi:hypothetical protein